MSDKSLRSKVIRLAHQKPELRKYLLPLVKNSGWNARGQFVDETGKVVNQYLMEGKYYVGDDYGSSFKSKDEMLATYKEIARARGYKKDIDPKSIKMFVEYEDGSIRTLSKRGR